MESSFVFVGNARLVVRWTGTGLPGLEKELEEMLAKYGLRLTCIGYDYIKRERELVFRPKEERQ